MKSCVFELILFSHHTPQARPPRLYRPTKTRCLGEAKGIRQDSSHEGMHQRLFIDLFFQIHLFVQLPILFINWKNSQARPPRLHRPTKTRCLGKAKGQGQDSSHGSIHHWSRATDQYLWYQGLEEEKEEEAPCLPSLPPSFPPWLSTKMKVGERVE